jgi:phospholipid transport system substrate-binding protein
MNSVRPTQFLRTGLVRGATLTVCLVATMAWAMPLSAATAPAKDKTAAASTKAPAKAAAAKTAAKPKAKSGKATTTKTAAAAKPAAKPQPKAKPIAVTTAPLALAATPARTPIAVAARPAPAAPAAPAVAPPPAVSVAALPPPSVAPAPAAAAPAFTSAANPTAFVNGFAARAVATLNDNRPTTARRAELETLMRDSFDFRSIGQFVLGRNWDSTPAAKREEFQQAFADYSITNYAKQLASFQVERMNVQTSRPAEGGGDTIVDTAVERRGQEPAMFGWRVHQAGGQARMVDVMFNGVSLATTQREEMGSYINRNGIDALINHMRQQVASAK